MRNILTATCFLLLSAACLAGADWPQWRGPGRDGSAVDSPRLLEAWPAGGPRRVWISGNIPVGDTYGWSSPVVAGGRVYMAASVSAKPDWRIVFHCLDSETGRTLWKRDYPSAGGGQLTVGSSSTVCAAGDRLYCAGPDGTLYCLKAADGALIWQVDGRTWWPLRTDGKREIHSSFLVADGVAVIQGGGHDGPHCNEGAVAALDAETGALLWSEQKYGGEGSPVLWRTGEQAYVLILARDGLTAFDLRTGKALWAVTPGSSSGTPLVVGDYAVILSDTIRKYGLTCYRLSPDKAEQVWQVADRYDPGSVPVVHDGHLYATAANRGENGGYTRATLLCVELATGALKWEEKTPCGGYTTPILADGKLIYANQGEVVMVAADPTRYRELGRMKIEADRYASPAIAGGRLFIRTGRGSWMVGGPGAIACYDLRAGK